MGQHQTAKVTIAWDAALNKSQLATAQNGFQQALRKFAANATWQILEFTRTPTKTNLEQVHAVAEARLPENDLAGLRDTAKALSNEGQTYTVQDIFYTPSFAEMTAARSQLRSQIYNQTKDELARLTSVYPNTGYRLNNISFYGLVGQTPNPSYMAKAVSVSEINKEPQSMSTSLLLTQDATVVFAAPSGNLCK